MMYIWSGRVKEYIGKDVTNIDTMYQQINIIRSFTEVIFSPIFHSVILIFVILQCYICLVISFY